MRGTSERLNLRSMEPEELMGLMKELGQPGFRAGQLFSWLAKGTEWTGMKNIPAVLKGRLEEEYRLYRPTVIEKQDSADGTVKLLWKLWDGQSVESVLMEYGYGCTACVSTQVGCAMGCAFCASTKGGFVRDLDAGEILEQVIFTGLETGKTVSRVVLMGIGEPMANFDEVMRFLRLINAPGGVGLGMRKISLSTCGLVDGIDKLAMLNVQLTLSVSLHSAVQEVRRDLMPAARAVSLERLQRSCREYFEKTGRRISYEYAMIDRVNDSDSDARALASWVRGAGGGHVNLIRLNRISESSLQPSPESRVRRFADLLQSLGVAVTVRRRLGTDIDAACGQLRRKTDGF